MKRKTIEKTLNSVFNKFVASIKDDKVKELVKKNTIITGGSIASMLISEKVNDYDLYFRNKETVLAVCEYYVKKTKEVADKLKISIPPIEVKYNNEDPDGRIKVFIKSSGIISFQAQKKSTEKYGPLFLTANAITLRNDIQLIIRFYGEPDKIHANYDFEHTKSYWCSWTGKVVIPPGSAEALLTRELKYTGSRYPLSSIIRTRKFIRRGWKLTAGEYLKMAIQLNDLNLLDINVLEDQLIGVDTSYFMTFISEVKDKIKAAKENNVPFVLSSSVVVEMIDRIFNEYDPEDEIESEEDEDPFLNNLNEN